jgi:uncharacterized protein with HEPN domain
MASDHRRVERTDVDYCADMVGAAQLIATYIRGATREQFDSDVETQDAVIRRLIVIGTAAEHISNAFRQAHTKVEWRKLARMGQTLSRQYRTIDMDAIWGLAGDGMPKMLRDLAKELA